MGFKMVLGIIVSYYPNTSELLESLISLKGEVEEICLVENGSTLDIQNEIKNIIQKEKKRIPSIKWIQMDSNIGLAAAQNIALEYGLKNNFDFYLFLDDDSILQKGSVANLKQFLIENPKYGLVGSEIIHEGSKRIQKYPTISSHGWIIRKYINNNETSLNDVSSIIASGSLLRLNCLKTIGLMRAAYFIDYIDIEFCLRIRSLGWKIAVIKNSKIIHKLGEERAVNLTLGKIYPTNHSPLRRYYMTRNRIWTWKMYAFTFPKWFIYDFINFCFDIVRFSIFDQDKFNKWKMFSKGILDGILKKEKGNYVS